MAKKHVIFLINLLQDVNIIRPLVFLAAEELDVEIEFLLSYRFLVRDSSRVWQGEIAEICASTGASVHIYGSELDALTLLRKKSGVIIAASESDLPAHVDTHNIFRLAPNGFLRVTLQHGFECVGFLQNREHNKAHGTSVKFGADVVCGWFGSQFMRSMAPSERPKLFVSGPPAVLQIPAANGRAGGGLVCENLHSVRLSASGDFKASFMDTFFQFCEEKARAGGKVFLRPHPGGQYVVKNSVILPDNVILNNRPIYKVDLSSFDFGISAPSSIIIDMVLSNIPVGVWSDADGVMDTLNYTGLTAISTLPEWNKFAEMAIFDRDRLLDRQRRFLDTLDMPVDPKEVRSRFLTLLSGATTVAREIESEEHTSTVAAVPAKARERILFFAGEEDHGFARSLDAPLEDLVERGEVVTRLVTDATLGGSGDHEVAIGQYMEDIDPTLVVFSGYSGRGQARLLKEAAKRDIPLIYHLDENLLEVPAMLDQARHDQQMRPERVACVATLLNRADLIYCPTTALKGRLALLGFKTPVALAEPQCCGEVIKPPSNGPVRTVGCVDLSGGGDVAQILPVLPAFLRDNPDVRLELLGHFDMPEALIGFDNQVVHLDVSPTAESFPATLAQLDWDIALCPVPPLDFYRERGDRRWVDMTGIGAAVITSADTAVAHDCADEFGLVCKCEADWRAALDRLCADPEARKDMVARAQARLASAYSPAVARERLLAVFSEARTLHAGAKPKISGKAEVVRRSSGPYDRILVAADNVSATQEISFRRPLAEMAARGDVSLTMVGDSPDLRDESAALALWKEVNPTVVFLSRFAEATETPLYRFARAAGIPIIFHIDDNLFTVPENLGKSKFEFYNDPARKAALRNAINACDLLYASTQILGQSIRKNGIQVPIFSGDLYCSVDPLNLKPYDPADVPTIGYMGTGGHAADLEAIMPAIVKLMKMRPDLRFETFGTIKPPKAMSAFADRYLHHTKTSTYDEFLERLGELGWWVGLAPLETHGFNSCKADTKWVEYTISGMPVVTSKISVYSRAVEYGTGFMATNDDSWYKHLYRLLDDKNYARQTVEAAQTKLRTTYRHDILAEQIFRVIDTARQARREAA